MPTSIQNRFGSRVRLLRKQRRWSQEEFADYCGLDRTYVSGIERGVCDPTLQIIEILAKALSVSMKELFADLDDD